MLVPPDPRDPQQEETETQEEPLGLVDRLLLLPQSAQSVDQAEVETI
jgi:hypothetical protein